MALNIYEMQIRPSKEQEQAMAQKIAQAKESLGTKYAHHPVNFVQRKAA